MKFLVLLIAVLFVTPAMALKVDCSALAEGIARQAKNITVIDVDEATGKIMEEKLNSAYHDYYAGDCDYATLEAAFKGTNLRALTKEEIN